MTGLVGTRLWALSKMGTSFRAPQFLGTEHRNGRFQDTATMRTPVHRRAAVTIAAVALSNLSLITHRETYC